MSLSGMPIQENYPLITELGLKQCITDSSYMRLIETKGSEVLAHNPECRDCEHARYCLDGCRASALETTPDDIMGRDMAACAILKGGWADRIGKLMETIQLPEKQ